MTVMMEHPIWSEDAIDMRDIYLGPNNAPGKVAIIWFVPSGRHELIIAGNAADDLMERYRAAACNISREQVLRNEITKAVSA